MAFRRTLRMETLGVIIPETTTTVTTIRIQLPHMHNNNN